MITPNFRNIDDAPKSLETKTYKVVGNKIIGYVDGLEAIKQAIYKILSTERQSYLIYSRNYGAELERFIGRSKGFVLADLERTIKDALLFDTRIKSIENFKISENKDDYVSISCIVKTIFGDIGIGGDIKV